MTNRSSTRIMIIFACILLFSCETKQNPVFELLEFRTEVKQHCSEYSPEDWENAFDKYTAICQRLDEMQFTTEERLEIDKIKGEIAGYAATVAAKEVSDEVKNIVNEIESFADGFSNTFKIPE